MSTDPTAYRLFWNSDHLGYGAEDAVLVPVPRWESTVSWMTKEPREAPNPVLFEANFKVTQHSDYPCNDVNWPLMSPRMLEVLCQVGDFPHRRIPVRLVTRRALGPAR